MCSCLLSSASASERLSLLCWWLWSRCMSLNLVSSSKMTRTPPPIARSSHAVTGDNRNGESIGEGALGSGNLRSRFEHRNLDRVTRSRNWLATTVGILALVALVLVAVGIVADTTGQNLAVSDP